MNEAFSTAFMLLAVGMITVFTILALIVVFGNVLISFVNKFIPEKKVLSPIVSETVSAIDPRKMAAIVSAVDVVTNGKGKVTGIRKA